MKIYPLHYKELLLIDAFRHKIKSQEIDAAVNNCRMPDPAIKQWSLYQLENHIASGDSFASPSPYAL